MRACGFMVVRDEHPLIEANVRWHLALGFEGLVIVDHASTDGTSAVLAELAQDARVKVLYEADEAFDHEKYANRALGFAVDHWNPEWLFPLDADEFLHLSTRLSEFLDTVERDGISYGSIKWLNALPTVTTSQRSVFETVRFYDPWPERTWEDDGHYRKSFCRSHEGIEVVVGGHYFRRENNPLFFSGPAQSPIPLPATAARLLHFERRGTPHALLAKWRMQADHLVEPRYPADAPWTEKLERLRELSSRYTKDVGGLEADWFESDRTFWGAPIPPERIQICTVLRDWNERAAR